MRRLIISLVFLIPGCASLDDGVGGISNTPEWFQTKRVEIRGEGYPDLSGVPLAETATGNIENDLDKEEYARTLLDGFLKDERSQPATISLDEIDARADEMNERLGLPSVAFDRILTSAEIAALRAKLQPPPIPN